ncbi:MAG: CtkA family protein [Erysipelotrichaceae bacterium]|nr:CtkA family protein [Erysipelotrichaceae bacterium]
MEVYDFNGYPELNESLGGNSGSKLIVVINGEKWMLKFPKTTIGMKNVEDSYTTSPLSEYLGSHIYQILGYNAHETILGIKDEKIVVGCRLFAERGQLLEFREIKNIYNKELEERLEQSLSDSSEIMHSTSIESVIIHLRNNPILKNVHGAEEMFWDQTIIDGLINNNDRNSGNWGLIKEAGNYIMSPVYDNGGSFSNKLSNDQIFEIMNDKERFLQSAGNGITAFSSKGKVLLFSDLLKYENNVLKERVLRLVPLISRKIREIHRMIDDIPERYGNFEVMSRIRKDFYKEGIKYRYENILKPRYQEIKKERQISRTNHNQQPER